MNLFFCVFQSLGYDSNEKCFPSAATAKPRYVTINERTGKAESVFVDLEAVYPNGTDNDGDEFCFEELRAKHRGWLNRDWSEPAPGLLREEDMRDSLELQKQDVQVDGPVSEATQDESADKLAMPPPKTIPLKDESTMSAAKKARREERANRTRKIVVEVRAETHTGKYMHRKF
jgi:checkpoint serine/threonine-protein kinase